MTNRYVVNLTPEEHSALEKLVNTGRSSAKKQIHARILLKVDISAGGSGWSDRKICEALEVSSSCVERVRKRLVEEGLEVDKGGGRKKGASKKGARRRVPAAWISPSSPKLSRHPAERQKSRCQASKSGLEEVLAVI